MMLKILIALAVNIFLAATVTAAPRQRLEKDTTFYVRKDGDDRNDGLTDSKNGAWGDLQFALLWLVDNLDTGAFRARLKIGPGVWSPSVYAGYICNGRHIGRWELIVEGAGGGDGHRRNGS